MECSWEFLRVHFQKGSQESLFEEVTAELEAVRAWMVGHIQRILTRAFQATCTSSTKALRQNSELFEVFEVGKCSVAGAWWERKKVVWDEIRGNEMENTISTRLDWPTSKESESWWDIPASGRLQFSRVWPWGKGPGVRALSTEERRAGAEAESYLRTGPQSNRDLKKTGLLWWPSISLPTHYGTYIQEPSRCPFSLSFLLVEA